MAKFFLTLIFVCSSVFYAHAHAEKFSAKEMAANMAGCRKALSQADAKIDRKDIEMLCSDPYLTGKPNESKADKARRMKLISKTDDAKAKMMSQYTQSKEIVKPCFDAVLSTEPGKDLKDVKMLCLNPYLTPETGELDEDRARRIRRIKENEAFMERMLDKFVVPIDSGTKKFNSAGAVR